MYVSYVEKKRVCDLSFKLKEVKYTEEKSKEAAVHKFKVNPCRIREIHHGNSKVVMEIALVLFLLKAFGNSWCSYALYTWWPLTTLPFGKYDR